MPIGLGLHVVIALFFAVHAVRSGQDRYWLWVLFVFPLLGSVVYGLAIWLPEWRYSHLGRQVVRGVQRKLDPTRELRAAQDAFDMTATTENRTRLADAMVEAGRPADAVPHYQAALRGIHADDPELHVRLARARLEAGEATQAREVLDELIRKRPDFRSPAGHLVYARAVAAEGQREKARHEFDTLVGYFSGFEAHAHYAEVLDRWGERDAAVRLRDESLQRARRLPAYARRMNSEWLRRLERIGAR
ncbi:tetratricopeptide repeat protein [Lysobacter sp. LF1]|uniref:Tetratricopeptide repeat protein n=1 Tax=Lysobacter stagni TaxID=3045172 RepID=A0ABT6XCF7_9GAMM|nr:tetratricopeptide repeat protein [Lysobacter sp. LF1]MDI9237817.1 tetratricopeptide repeat protein [Lysobacter sp. LF1]